MDGDRLQLDLLSQIKCPLIMQHCHGLEHCVWCGGKADLHWALTMMGSHSLLVHFSSSGSDCVSSRAGWQLAFCGQNGLPLPACHGTAYSPAYSLWRDDSDGGESSC